MNDLYYFMKSVEVILIANLNSLLKINQQHNYQ